MYFENLFDSKFPRKFQTILFSFALGVVRFVMCILKYILVKGPLGVGASAVVIEHRVISRAYPGSKTSVELPKFGYFVRFSLSQNQNNLRSNKYLLKYSN